MRMAVNTCAVTKPILLRYCSGTFPIDEVALDFLLLGVRADLAHRRVPPCVNDFRLFAHSSITLACGLLRQTPRSTVGYRDPTLHEKSVSHARRIRDPSSTNMLH